MNATGTAEPSSSKPRLIAFYLPQFHPIPENDAWWGKGFTEWTNVTRARPLFPRHYQPQLPADLGFYDLRVPEARWSQAELARACGIEGFCYWHYWFHGKRLIERPFAEVLGTGKPEYPFCLAWANEAWTRSWMGGRKHYLLEQTYSVQDDQAHANWLVGAFADPRYLRVNGRPLFLIYQPRELPEPRRTTDTFRSTCLRHGLPEPYLVGINANGVCEDMRHHGFDMSEFHEPRLGLLPDAFRDGWSWSKLMRNLRHWVPRGDLKLTTYQTMIASTDRVRPAFPHFPCCFVGFDNTARRGRDAIVMTGATPDAFRDFLRACTLRVEAFPPQERLVFLNSWNEWAEGMYLEPNQRDGHAFLNVLREVTSLGNGLALRSVAAGAPPRSV